MYRVTAASRVALPLVVPSERGGWRSARAAASRMQASTATLGVPSRLRPGTRPENPPRWRREPRRNAA